MTLPDPFLWLEDIDSPQAMHWVHARNAASHAQLANSVEFDTLRTQLAEVLNAGDRIPSVTRRGDWLYNFWQDETHQRGLWRRTTLVEYKKAAPAWDVVLDIDALALAENENWVWAGATCLAPHYELGLILLSRGGGDAVVVREFNTRTKVFVARGFYLPEAKSDVYWVDADTLYVGTDNGPGSLTTSGYPRTIKRWQRGSLLAQAPIIFEGQAHDVSVGASVYTEPGFERTLFHRTIDFYKQQHFVLQGESLVPLDIPSDATPYFMRDILLLQTRSDWQPHPDSPTFPKGSLLQTSAQRYMQGEHHLTEKAALFTPTATCSMADYHLTRDHILINTLDHVSSHLLAWKKQSDTFTPVAIATPPMGSVSVRSLYDPQLGSEDPLGEYFWLTHTDFLTPDTLMLCSTEHPQREPIKVRKSLFDAAHLHTQQCFATSKDGTQIPYFLVAPKAISSDATCPTVLYGYGGFEHSLKPWYAAGFGRAWLARGGALAVANIRGGGEYGPAWHQSATLENKQRCFDDFCAVAQHLIQKKITSPKHLGIMGGSNGGLLVGATFVQHPELFNAVVCQVPLLDMQRYHALLAGASWMAEYGNPDNPDQWQYLARYSPYHNLQPGVQYPKVLFTTSTRDDRVHPGHARKMAARMLCMGIDCLYYENTEGGHGGAANTAQRAHLQALEFAYLWQQLGLET
jgi:prolyl oligopeptidase